MIRCTRVSCGSGRGDRGLRGVSLHLPKGSMGFVVGPSGACKTLLLQLCYGEFTPERGTVLIDGIDTKDMRGRSLRRMRRAIGYITPGIPLLEHRSILDNVLVPFELRRMGWRRSVRASLETLDRLGMLHLAHVYPGDLSAGERALAMIARAVAHRPGLVLVDDLLPVLPESVPCRVVSEFSDMVLRGSAVLVATRAVAHAPPGTRVWQLRDGIVDAYDTVPPRPTARQSAVLTALLGSWGAT